MISIPQQPDPRSSGTLTERPLPVMIKILDCLFASIAVADFYNSLMLYPTFLIPALFKFRHLLLTVNIPVLWGAALFAVIFPILWQRRERRGFWRSSADWVAKRSG